MKNAAVLITLALSAYAASAQTRVPVREIGKLERVTTDSLRSVTEAIQMSNGKVLVNDAWSKRVLLLDSTLAHPIVVADTTSATANAYGMHRGGTIMRYRGDSALYLDQIALTMFLVPPSGVVGRVMAFPPPPTKEDQGQLVTGGETGPPGFDARGRLIYVNETGAEPGSVMLLGSTRAGNPALPPSVSANMYADSTLVFRADLATRITDTIGFARRAKGVMRLRRVEGLVTAIENSFDPLPVVDQWAMLADGTFAIVRGRDYHVDWLGSTGAWTSTPKMEFDWQRVTDERKTQLRDSVDRVQRDRLERSDRSLANAPALPPSGGGRGGGDARGGGGDRISVGPRKPVPNVVIPMALGDVADYVPPFSVGAVRADADGNIWIRTSAMKGDRPIYDVVNRKGEVVDRVQLPAFRTIAGFGPGVIYMAMKDSSGAVRLERARIH